MRAARGTRLVSTASSPAATARLPARFLRHAWSVVQREKARAARDAHRQPGHPARRNPARRLHALGAGACSSRRSRRPSAPPTTACSTSRRCPRSCRGSVRRAASGSAGVRASSARRRRSPPSGSSRRVDRAGRPAASERRPRVLVRRSGRGAGRVPRAAAGTRRAAEGPAGGRARGRGQLPRGTPRPDLRRRSTRRASRTRTCSSSPTTWSVSGDASTASRPGWRRRSPLACRSRSSCRSRTCWRSRRPGTSHFAFGLRSAQLASAAMSFDEVFVLQSVASNLLQLRGRVQQGLRHPGPALFSIYAGPAGGALPGYLASAAAMQSRAFPAFTYDPAAGSGPRLALFPREQPAARARLARRARSATRTRTCRPSRRRSRSRSWTSPPATRVTAGTSRRRRAPRGAMR